MKKIILLLAILTSSISLFSDDYIELKKFKFWVPEVWNKYVHKEQKYSLYYSSGEIFRLFVKEDKTLIVNKIMTRTVFKRIGVWIFGVNFKEFHEISFKRFSLDKINISIGEYEVLNKDNNKMILKFASYNYHYTNYLEFIFLGFSDEYERYKPVIDKIFQSVEIK